MGVAVGTGVFVGAGVEVGSGVLIGAAVVSVGAGVGLGVAVGVGVGFGVGVRVGVGVGVGVAVGMGVGVGAVVGVGVGVGVGDEQATSTSISPAIAKAAVTAEYLLLPRPTPSMTRAGVSQVQCFRSLVEVMITALALPPKDSIEYPQRTRLEKNVHDTGRFSYPFGRVPWSGNSGDSGQGRTGRRRPDSVRGHDSNLLKSMRPALSGPRTAIRGSRYTPHASGCPGR